MGDLYMTPAGIAVWAIFIPSGSQYIEGSGSQYIENKTRGATRVGARPFYHTVFYKSWAFQKAPDII